jgi:hypothetical protein
MDYMEDNEEDAVTPEVLNTLRFSGFPDHTIALKVNMPVILL